MMLCVPAPLPASIAKRLMCMRNGIAGRKSRLRWLLVIRTLEASIKDAC